MTNEKLKTGQSKPVSELSLFDRFFIVRFSFFILPGECARRLRAFPRQGYFFVTT